MFIIISCELMFGCSFLCWLMCHISNTQKVHLPLSQCDECIASFPFDPTGLWLSRVKGARTVKCFCLEVSYTLKYNGSSAQHRKCLFGRYTRLRRCFAARRQLHHFSLDDNINFWYINACEIGLTLTGKSVYLSQYQDNGIIE